MARPPRAFASLMKPELHEPAIEPRPRHAQQLRRRRFVAARLGERPRDDFAFDRLEQFVEHDFFRGAARHRGRLRRVMDDGRQIGRRDFVRRRRGVGRRDHACAARRVRPASDRARAGRAPRAAASRLACRSPRLAASRKNWANSGRSSRRSASVGTSIVIVETALSSCGSISGVAFRVDSPRRHGRDDHERAAGATIRQRNMRLQRRRQLFEVHEQQRVPLFRDRAGRAAIRTPGAAIPPSPAAQSIGTSLPAASLAW